MYDPNQPRLPAGDRYGGRWTSSGLGGGPMSGRHLGLRGGAHFGRDPRVQPASAVLPAAGLGPAAMRIFAPAFVPYLRGLLTRLPPGGVASLGLLGVWLIHAYLNRAVEGELPGHPDIRYRYKAGVLTIWQDVPGDDKPLLYHGPAGADGLYRLPDGTVIGRDLGRGILLSEESAEMEKRRKAEARDAAIAAAIEAGAKVQLRNEPEICPAATKAPDNNDVKRWRRYQVQITEMDSDSEIMLNGVSYDGCQNIPGGILLLEAKGPGFADKLEQDGDFVWWYKKGRLEVAIQMKKQSIAAGRHTVEWHVAEASMVSYLRRLAGQLSCHNIKVVHTPAKFGQVAP